jgi:hypothetical protein
MNLGRGMKDFGVGGPKRKAEMEKWYTKADRIWEDYFCI